jgi:predicted metal-dependent peptidase
MAVATKKKHWEPDPNITNEQLTVMQEAVIDCIITARVGLLLRHPFFGNMATRLRVVAADDWLPTAAVDGRNLYFNTQFFYAMDNEEIEFVIAHEILHCVFDHLERREDRVPVLHNIASDYKVNNTLVRDRIGKRPKLVDIYQDFKYESYTSEDIYDELFNEAQKNWEKMLKKLEEEGELLDEHIDWEENQDGDPSKGRPTYSKEELKKIRDEIKENMISAAQCAGAGNVPKEVQRMIKELTEPKMDWRQLLRQQIQSTIRNDYTFARPSRKSWHTGAVLPGMNFDETIDICVSIDTSGSISDAQAKDFLSEIKGIMEEYKDYQIKIWCFDTKTYNEDNFTANDGRDLLDYKLYGGGGTDFMVNWNYMKYNDIVPKKFIMFTDGYPCGSWGDSGYCDTVFIIHSNHDKGLQAPFGVTAHYEELKNR